MSFSLTQGSPPLPQLDFGLLRFLRGFPEPTIHFFDWSAVSPSKSRDFRFRCEVTSGSGHVTSGSGHVPSGSGHVPSGSGHVTSP